MFISSVPFCVLFSICAVVYADTTFKTPSDRDGEPYKPFPAPKLDSRENEVEFWKNQAQNTLHEKLAQKLNTNRAKNVVFFLGDGLSIPTITAARIYQGQLANRTGEEEQLFFETFPYTGLSKTYCTDVQVADSACTATAYLSGVKTNVRCIGVSAAVKVADCEAAKIPANRPTSILKWAQDAGMATGIVTTTRVTHASPAGTYAHVPFRDMECDADVLKKSKLDPVSCNFDIAKQLVYEEPGKDIKVIMGGGRNKFLPYNITLSKHEINGSRLDEDLVYRWKEDKISKKANATYITNVNDLKSLNIDKVDYLLGLFAPEHLAYHLDNKKDQPTLEEMTETAIKILQKNANGFFLFVEGGEIDIGHHENLAHKALDETVEFAKAIRKASEMTSEEDTLIVVTADHAHTMSMSGYPARGHDILGLYSKGKDGLPYATLSYANGPGYHNQTSPGVRYNLANDDTDAINYTFPALVPKRMETHGGDDVAVYARGPWAHLFSGNYEQNYIPIAEAYAAGIGPSATAQTTRTANSSFTYTANYLLVVSMFAICVIVKYAA